MRFTVGINLKGTPPFQLPASYRRNIVVLIKKAIKSCDDADAIYNSYWGMENIFKIKPYTFFLSVSEPSFIDLDYTQFFQLDRTSVELHISSSDSDFLSSIYNGLLNINNSLTLFNYPIELKDFFLRKITSINSNFVKFKILSPIIVKNFKVEKDKKQFQGYLSCNDPDFVESIISSIWTLSNRLLPDGARIQKDDIEIDTSGCSVVKIYHYQEDIFGTMGTIGIKAKEEILELIYDTGLGARRSQGYGMLDIVKEGNYIYMPISEELITNN